MSPSDDERSPSPVVRFYLGTGTDARGRRIEEIWGWDDVELERVHDYIQWLFPLRASSRFNAAAPVLTPADVEKFKVSDVLRSRLTTSLLRMLRFYGLQLRSAADGDALVDTGEAWADRCRRWLERGNHNHLRLTRIMTSTDLLGLHEEAAALQRCLLAIGELHPTAISIDTLRYWRRAVVV